ncbi:FkbM family methyltransferase [Roseivivax sp. THAF30]|uniref:FkbM family methyltransferase n=1 Tax=Roseivivax sp. THAF30 TaxID=2587852 RepID=UPI001267EDB7|nr:FkbM family methyltransferase [Roseivivax sp. THAF30]QFT62683.1 hypothetical protein FIU91_07065 [Roseivivax sp. THAF30]
MNQWLGFGRSFVIYCNPLAIRTWRRFYRSHLTTGDLVFDIGAHMGTRARAMRSAGARVIALEPQMPFARFLRHTLPKDITLIEAAAGETETEAEMAVSSRHPTVSSLTNAFVAGAANTPGFDHVRWDRRQTVRVVTLDGLIAQFGHPRYIKIDVEGFELQVLSGLSQAVPLISVEYLPAFPDLTHAVIDRLSALGPYTFNAVSGETGAFLWPEWRQASEVRDWLSGLSPTETSGDLFARLG